MIFFFNMTYCWIEGQILHSNCILKNSFVKSALITSGGYQFEPDLSGEGNDQDEDLLYVRPDPVRTRNPLLCQKSSSSSGYETCISSVSDNNTNVKQPREPQTASDQSNTATAGSSSTQPLAPPRSKRGLTKVSKAATANKVNSANSGKFFFLIKCDRG